MNTLNIFLIYLSQVSWTQEQKTIKTITDREKGVEKKEEIVSTLFMDWKQGAETNACTRPVFTGVTWSQGGG